MELKTIIAMAITLLVIFLKIRSERNNQPGAAMRGCPLQYPEKK